MERKKNNMLQEKLYFIAWGIVVVMLLMGVMGIHSSYLMKDYRCVDGKVTDVEEVEVWRRGGPATRYNYKIEWQDQGKQHAKWVYKVVDRPDESQRKVWVNKDSTDVSLGNAEDAKESGYKAFGVAGIAFLAVLLLAPKKSQRKNRSKDEIESLYYTSVVLTVLMVITDLFLLVLFRDNLCGKVHVEPVFWDFAVATILVLIISIIVTVRLKKKLK